MNSAQGGKLAGAHRRLYGVLFDNMVIGRELRLLTLTSSRQSPPSIHHSFRLLVLRIRRRWRFEYLAVREFSKGGLIHIHCVFWGSYIPQEWLSSNWNAIHQAKIVYIQRVRPGVELCRYLGKYLAKAFTQRLLLSREFVFRWARSLRCAIWKWFRINFKFVDPTAFRFYWDCLLKGEWLKFGDLFVKLDKSMPVFVRIGSKPEK